MVLQPCFSIKEAVIFGGLLKLVRPMPPISMSIAGRLAGGLVQGCLGRAEDALGTERSASDCVHALDALLLDDLRNHRQRLVEVMRCILLLRHLYGLDLAIPYIHLHLDGAA